MNHCVCFVIMVLSFGGVSEASASPEPRWDELRTIDSVSGRAIGFAGAPGAFFSLSKVIIGGGTQEHFRWLLSDEQPVVRSMGLLALAQVNGRAAAPVLRSYLYDPGKIEYCPGGCCVAITTVGHFAWRLLLDANHLGHSDMPAPLLTASEQIGLEIEFLAADSLMGPRLDAAEHLTTIIRDGTLLLQLSTLRAHAPTLEDYRIVQGIGRLKPSVKQRDFLIACPQDKSLDANARLAAGSALTRHTDDMAFGAIQRECDSLNALDERHWGDQFIETMSARKVHERNMQPLNVERAWWRDQLRQVLPSLFSATDERDDATLLAKRTWQGLDEIKDQVVVALTCRHPLALDDLLRNHDRALVRDDPDVRRAAVNSMIEISRSLKDYNQPWSTYADSASILAIHVQGERQTKFPQSRILTDAECDEIERNIVESRRAEQSCPGEELIESVNAVSGGDE